MRFVMDEKPKHLAVLRYEKFGAVVFDTLSEKDF